MNASKIISKWVINRSVGIYDNCELVVKLYDDRVLCTIPEVRWTSHSTGGYHERKERITSKYLIDQLKRIAQNESEDGQDYSDKVTEQLFLSQII